MASAPSSGPDPRSPERPEPDPPGPGARSESRGDAGSPSLFTSFRRAETLMAQRRPLDAVQALLPVLAAQPDDTSVHLLAGRAFLDSAQLHRAEASFSRVLELDPADHYARFALGKALQRQGRFTEALAQLKMATAMDPRPEYQDAIGEVSARLALEPDR